MCFSFSSFSTSSHSRHIQTCKRVFQSLLKIAIEELCETADALIAPVRLGVVRPTAPFTLSTSSIDVSTTRNKFFFVKQNSKKNFFLRIPMIYSQLSH